MKYLIGITIVLGLVVLGMLLSLPTLEMGKVLINETTATVDACNKHTAETERALVELGFESYEIKKEIGK